MTVPINTLIPSALPRAGHSPVGTQSTFSPNSGAAGEVKLRKAAGEFEAILVGSLWKSMKDTFGDGEQDGESIDPTLQNFDDWGVQGMAGAMGQAGGFGIKNMILRYLDPQQKNPAQGASSGSAGSHFDSISHDG
jgi:Rod binding domain-containing protein